MEKGARWPTELLCLLLFQIYVNSHTCVVSSSFAENRTSPDSQKQFRGISRRHQKGGLWLARRTRESFFGITNSRDKQTGEFTNQWPGLRGTRGVVICGCPARRRSSAGKKLCWDLLLLKIISIFNLSLLKLPKQKKGSQRKQVNYVKSAQSHQMSPQTE